MKTTLSFLSEKSGTFLLMLLLLLIPEASFAQTDNEAVTDAAILPWLGTWTAIDETPATRTAVLEIRPGADGRSLDITTKGADQPVSENIIPDGISRSVESQNCTGTHKYQWEKQAGILLGTSEIACNEASYSIFTLKMLTSTDRMTDILAIKTPDQTRLAVRRFAFENELQPVGDFFSVRESLVLRTALAAPWDLDKIINLSKTVETFVLEAALLERNLHVTLDTKSLRKMKSAGTPDSIIDLLVAMSAPDKFRIEKNEQIAVEAASPSPQSGEAYSYSYGMGAPYYYGYYHPWNYYWSYSSPFWWGYPIYMYYPTYPNITIPGGGGGSGGGGGGRPSSHSGGRLSAGGGYVQITPRDTGSHAVPRGSVTPGAGYATTPGGRATYSGNPASYGTGASAAPSGGGSAGYSAGSSGASASPSGYSGGGNSGTAVPR